jgi:hypothetical protein
MPKRSLPYFFLAFLFAILLFILGIRYGQRVELANKTIRYLVSIPPTPTLQPTIASLSFSDYTHSGCAISFLIPSSLEKTKESSTSALFVDIKKQLAIAVSCEKKPYLQEKNEVAYTINRTVRAFQTTTKDTVSYRFFNAKNMKVVTITTFKKYLPLIDKSLELTP